MTTSVFLNNDRTMPLLGLGLYKTTDAVEAEDAIAAAVQNGYRLLDTASAYKNEEFVGCGIAKCGVPRKDLFITTKIWNNAQRLGDVEGAFQRSLDRIGNREIHICDPQRRHVGNIQRFLYDIPFRGVSMAAVGHLIKIIFHIYSPLLSQFSIIYSRMVAYLRVFKPKIKKGE